MAQGNRKNRTPFTADLSWLSDNNGECIAYCSTPQLAHFLMVTANYFDQLSQAARVCLGEYENLDNPENYPGYVELKRLVDEYERALRG